MQEFKSRMPATALGFAVSACFSLLLLWALQRDASAQSSDVRANVGSQWTFEVTDEITKNKFVNELVVTEITADQIVLRISSSPNANVSTAVADRNWNIVEFGLWKYSPHDFSGVQRSPGATPTAQSDSQYEASYRLTTGWSAPIKTSISARVIGTENVTTKAGTFEAVKIEYVKKIPTPNMPLSETVATETKWFAPAIDHFVKTTSETRVDSRLRSKVTTELQKYVLQK